MFTKTLLYIVVIFIYKVNSQLCGCRPNIIPTPILPNPIRSPTSCTTPPSTIIVDNSVSLGLANAIQLLVVSSLIDSTIPGISRPHINTICEKSFPCYRPYEIFAPEYTIPYIPSVEVINPYLPVIETIPPRFCGGYIDTVTPFCGPYDNYPNYFGMTETVSPNFFGWTEIIAPTPCGGLTEVITPPCFPVTSNYPIVNMAPNIFGVTEFSPCQTLPFSPYYGGNDIITAYPPNFGFTEILPNPISETFSVPFQICNSGYSPNIMPCINEVPIEGCGCGCGNLIYY